jgi:hypothetical protein
MAIFGTDGARRDVVAENFFDGASHGRGRFPRTDNTQIGNGI